MFILRNSNVHPVLLATLTTTVPPTTTTTLGAICPNPPYLYYMSRDMTGAWTESNVYRSGDTVT
jgi:hypothetical protein